MPPSTDPVSVLNTYAQANGYRPEYEMTKNQSTGQWVVVATCEAIDYKADGCSMNQKEAKRLAAENMVQYLDSNNLLRQKRARPNGKNVGMKTYCFPTAAENQLPIEGLWCDSKGNLASVEGINIFHENRTRSTLRVEDGYYIRKALTPDAKECSGALSGTEYIDWADGDRWELAQTDPGPDVGDFNEKNAKMVLHEFLKRKRLPEVGQPTQFNVGTRVGFRAIAAFEVGGYSVHCAVTSQNKRQASIDLAIQVCRRLFSEGHMTERGMGAGPGGDHYPELTVGLSPEIKNKLQTFLYNMGIIPRKEDRYSGHPIDVYLRMEASGWACSTEDISKGCRWSPATGKWDPWKYKTTGANCHVVNEELYRRWNNMNLAREKVASRHELPIAHMEHEIVELIVNNQVVLVSGSTGSGKTTQIPQFILDYYISYNRGSECNIIVTQPRRVAAISIAERVAWERGEQLGDSVGYSVRFDQKMPRSSGSIMYMTVGILLRKLESGLHGVSHIFIDEVHERDLNTDFLLVVVKRLCRQHANLRVILMSATISLDKFIKYFPGSKVVEILGRNFPVETFFLEDAVELLSFDAGNQVKHQNDSLMVCDSRYTESTKRALRAMSEQEVNYSLVEKILEWVMGQQENPEMAGSVLIFLPGWEVISHMMRHLKRVFSAQCVFLPLHSQVPKDEQRRVFDNPPVGKIKVILSTNIAETSVTIRDVVYVIDSCRCKIRWFQASTSAVMTPAMLSRLDVHWAAKHNLTQREGRAGRLRPGFCFRLCTRARYDSLPDTLPPEMVRAPLHDVALVVKWLQLGDIKDFLLQCPDPPKIDAIDRAIITLQDLSALDTYQRLTPVGVQLARLPMEPRMGYALLMSAIFGLAEPMSLIFSTLCYKDPFGPDFPKLGEHSDLFRILAQIYEATSHGHRTYNDRMVNGNTLRQILDAAQQLLAILLEIGFPQQQKFMGIDPGLREWHLIQYFIALGLNHWGVFKDPRKLWLGTNEVGNMAQNSACAIDGMPEEAFYTYFEQARNHTKIQCRMLSNLPIIPIMLGSLVSMPWHNERVLLDHWLPITCRFDTAALIGAARAGTEAMMLRIAHTPGLCSSTDQPLAQFIGLMYDLVDPQAGKCYEYAS